MPGIAAPFPVTSRPDPQARLVSGRRIIPFRSINHRSLPGHDPSLQRHHILPRQLLSLRCFGSMFERIGRDRFGFDDFRSNGLLLPATEEATIRTGMPLHRGPHQRYNEVVMARVGRIEERWARTRPAAPEAALEEALLRLQLLQGALRRQLLAERRRVLLNRRDPLGTGYDFTELDAMAEALWAAECSPIPLLRRVRPKGRSPSGPAAAPVRRDTPARTGQPDPRPCRPA